MRYRRYAEPHELWMKDCPEHAWWDKTPDAGIRAMSFGGQVLSVEFKTEEAAVIFLLKFPNWFREYDYIPTNYG